MEMNLPFIAPLEDRIAHRAKIAASSIRKKTLDSAMEAVTVDRAATHGDVEDNFRNIAKIWSARVGVTVTPAQVAIMLIDLKTVRAWSNPQHHDNWVDMAGYAACGAEVST